MYWTAVALYMMLAALTSLGVIFGDGLWRLAAFGCLGIEVILVVKLWRMAMRPIRLEIGMAGIQVFFAKSNAWLPWELIDRVDVTRVDGNLAVVAWTRYATVYPPLAKAGVGAYYVPAFEAVAACPLGPLKAKRQDVVRALQYYGQNRY
ncbi:hypothetical protein FB561_3426 [Kribbella amoyensis]|uniref:Uncharacterized protein n=2 Tax=Kribbella amoyensis TaxID=996641 RepID=A0A561BTV5_9ACTN|nr:hypothetical protein FB561_3426 [Kribbella amoyensis]